MVWRHDSRPLPCRCADALGVDGILHMTTIVCNRLGMAADKRATGPHLFRITKLFRIHGSIIGVCGMMEHCLKFVEWRRIPDTKPLFGDAPNFAALELTQNGKILYWSTEMIAVPVEEDFFAVGSGSAYALGALSKGAGLKESIAIASKYDESTGAEIQVMQLKGR